MFPYCTLRRIRWNYHQAILSTLAVLLQRTVQSCFRGCCRPLSFESRSHGGISCEVVIPSILCLSKNCPISGTLQCTFLPHLSNAQLISYLVVRPTGTWTFFSVQVGAQYPTRLIFEEVADSQRRLTILGQQGLTTLMTTQDSYLYTPSRRSLRAFISMTADPIRL